MESLSGQTGERGFFACTPEFEPLKGLRNPESDILGQPFSPEWATVGPCHVLTYHRRLLSNEWMTSVPTVRQHMFTPANHNFTRGNFPLVRAVNGLSDPKPDPIA